MRKSIPDYYAKSIFDVPVSFFKKEGFQTVLLDLDNTLDSYDTLEPSSRVFKLKKKLVDENIRIFIISNNHGNRVSHYAEVLGVPYLAHTRKPFGKRLRKFLIKEGVLLEKCILCGDQLITDIPCGKRAGIKTLLLDPISKKDQWTTRFNRLFDRPKRKRMKKKGKIKYMEDDYGKENNNQR